MSRLRRTLRLPHAGILLAAALTAGSAELLWLTRFNLTAIISVSLLFSSISLALVYGLQAVLQGIIAGVMLRIERNLKAGETIAVGGPTGPIGTVHRIRLRTTDLITDTGVWPVPNTTLLAGFEIRPQKDPA